MSYLKIYTDGGSRGNPGPGAVGVVIRDKKDRIIFQEGRKIGWTTNNQAEYQALIEALKWVKKNHPQAEKIDFFLDSKLVVSQMKGGFKVKSDKIKPLWQEAKNLESSLKAKISYHHLGREMNFEADRLLNQALDLLKSE